MDGRIIANNSYANNPNVKFGAHYVELLEPVSYENNIGKFSMSYINPNTNTASAIDTVLPKNPATNVQNSNANQLGINRITSSNYVQIVVPKYLFYVTGVDIKAHGEGEKPVATVVRKTYNKGQKFVVVNCNGDYNSPVIVGVVE
jgi:hypothetical protein